ncbi:MAG: CHASE2 domain-containing protein, partial [Candidatus Aureabacteria bacterium]|nr:CHASE2 domain-containing protein [Candidatus Auribacterota bacterium]
MLYHLHFELLHQLEFKLIDAKFRLRGPITPASPISLIAIDKKSIATLGKWPWDRRMIAQLIREISRKGAKVIALDMVFTSPDRDPVSDEELVQAIRDSGRVILGCFFNFSLSGAAVQSREEYERMLKTLSRFRISLVTDISNSDTHPMVTEAMEAETNVPPLNAAIAGCGYYNVCQEKDGRVRRVPLIAQAGGDFYPHLSLAVLKEYLGERNLRIILNGPYPVFVEAGSLKIPTDSRGQLFLNYYGPAQGFRTFPAWKLLSGAVPDNALRGKIVLVGGTSTNDFQMLHTPFEPHLSSMELIATCIDNMLCGRALIESPKSVELTIACIIGFPILLGFVMPRRGRTLLGFATVVALTAIFLASAFYLFALANIQMNTIYPLLAIFSSYMGILLHTSIKHERRSSRLICLVNEVGLAISSTLDLGALLPKILESMMKAVEVNRGILLTCDANGMGMRNLRIVCQQNMSLSVIEGGDYSYAKEIISRVGKEGRSIVIGDVRRLKNIAIDGSNRRELPLSIFCLPLAHGGKAPLGIVYMEKTSRGGDLWDEDIRLIDSMATQAAIAIENASMYSNLRQEGEKLREEVIHL